MPGNRREPVAARNLYVAAALTLAADQLSKLAVAAHVAFGESLKISSWLWFSPAKNTGAAFGLFRGYGAVLAGMAAAAAALIFAYGTRDRRSPLSFAALGLLAGGALGNLADRLARGYVFDFIDVRFWPVFNLADCAITVGAAVLVLDILLTRRTDRQGQDT